MKKLLTIMLFLAPFIGMAQDQNTADVSTKPITSFLGIKFGGSHATVSAALKAKGFTIKQPLKKDILGVEKIKLGRHSGSLIVRFIDNKAYKAVFILVATTENRTIELYNDLVTDISSVYGEAQNVTKKFKQPYEDGDGYEITALKEGAADYETSWDDKDGNYIMVNIDEDLIIRVVYGNAELEAIADKKTDAKEKADF